LDEGKGSREYQAGELLYPGKTKDQDVLGERTFIIPKRNELENDLRNSFWTIIYHGKQLMLLRQKNTDIMGGYCEFFSTFG
jgi:hypothetical protein